MQNYLGYEKNQHNNSENTRNGINSKKLITQQGKIEINLNLLVFFSIFDLYFVFKNW
ncbi:hypothetical protein [Spiroplasma ixodetis]